MATNNKSNEGYPQKLTELAPWKLKGLREEIGAFIAHNEKMADLDWLLGLTEILANETDFQNPLDGLIEEMAALDNRLKRLEEKRNRPTDPNVADKEKLDTVEAPDFEILRILKEENEVDDPQSDSMIAIAKAYLHQIQSQLETKSTEMEKMETLHILLADFLTKIAGTRSAIRSQLLDLMAEVANEHLTEFYFVSPETSRKFNTGLHRFVGKANIYIGEGVSYLIQRTKNDVVYRKATVKA